MKVTFEEEVRVWPENGCAFMRLNGMNDRYGIERERPLQAGDIFLGLTQAYARFASSDPGCWSGPFRPDEVELPLNVLRESFTTDGPLPP